MFFYKHPQLLNRRNADSLISRNIYESLAALIGKGTQIFTKNETNILIQDLDAFVRSS